MEDYLEEFSKVKEEILLRIAVCQLCNEDEFNQQIKFGSDLFDLKGLRFDKLILADETGNICDQGTRSSKSGIHVMKKRKPEILGEVAENHESKRTKSCEEGAHQGYNSTDPDECSTAGSTICRETFNDKDSYIEAWAKNQAESNIQCDGPWQIDPLLNDSKCNIVEKSNSVQIPLDTPMKCDLATDRQSGREGERIICNKRSLDHNAKVLLNTQLLTTRIPLEEMGLFKLAESFRETDSVVVDHNLEKVRVSTPRKIVTFNENISMSPQTSSLKIDIHRESVNVSKGDTTPIKNENENIEGMQRTERKETQLGVNSDGAFRNQTIRVDIMQNDRPMKEEFSARESSTYIPLKITLVRIGCYSWAVKQQNEVHSEERLVKDETARIGILHELDEKAIKRMETLNRVKQALAQENSSQPVRMKLKTTKRFKALKQKAATLCAMKCQIIGRK